MAQLPNARGRLFASGSRAMLAVRCPLCNAEHRYDKGALDDPAVAELQELGFSEEWMPCQFDLPGNFWRISFGRERRRRPAPRRDDGPGRPRPA